MVRVLHVLGGLNLGGAESRIMDLYRHMDRNQVQFDFLVHMDEKEYARAIKEGVEPETCRKPQFFDEQIQALGGHIYALPKYKVYNIGAYKKAIRRFFKAHHDYSVVQGHMTSTASIYLPIAKACSIINRDESPADGIIDDEVIAQLQTIVTVAHTRNAGVDAGIKGIVVKNLRKSLPKRADFLFACSHLAGDETFGGAPYTYIPNTIDTQKFVFDESDRNDIREEYGISGDAVVIGNVARFSPQKKQKYLIEAFAKLIGLCHRFERSNALYLILCGDGSLKEECEKYAQDLGISDKVVFAGNQSEVWKYYSTMDIYAFPSEYEGLPGVMVEAQASGLRCLMSDTITTDVLLTDVTEAMSIEGSAQIWADKLYQMMDEVLADREKGELGQVRGEYASQVRSAGFDVNDQAQKMMQFYLQPCKDTLPV